MPTNDDQPGGGAAEAANDSGLTAPTGPKRYYDSGIDPTVLLTDTRTDHHVQVPKVGKDGVAIKKDGKIVMEWGPRTERVEYSPALTAGVERILQEGRTLLPTVAAWLLEQYEVHGIDFRYPGPRLPEDEKVTRRIPLALGDPSNVDIDRSGRISVVTLHGDEPIAPVLSIPGEPFVTLEEGLRSGRAIRYYDKDHLPQGAWTLDGEPAELPHRQRPIHGPVRLYTGETGPDAQISPTLEDVSTLSPTQRAVLARYGKALSVIRAMNSMSEENNANYSTYKWNYRREMEALVAELATETLESEIPVALARVEFGKRWKRASEARIDRLVERATAGTAPGFLIESVNRGEAVEAVSRLQEQIRKMRAEMERIELEGVEARRLELSVLESQRAEIEAAKGVAEEAARIALVDKEAAVQRAETAEVSVEKAEQRALKALEGLRRAEAARLEAEGTIGIAEAGRKEAEAEASRAKKEAALLSEDLALLRTDHTKLAGDEAAALSRASEAEKSLSNLKDESYAERKRNRGAQRRGVTLGGVGALVAFLVGLAVHPGKESSSEGVVAAAIPVVAVPDLEEGETPPVAAAIPEPQGVAGSSSSASAPSTERNLDMAQVLANPRVQDYLNEHSLINAHFNDTDTFEQIKTVLLAARGFGGAYEFAQEEGKEPPKTINEYLMRVRAKDPALAARMKAEFQMFGLKDKTAFDAFVLSLNLNKD